MKKIMLGLIIILLHIYTTLSVYSQVADRQNFLIKVDETSARSSSHSDVFKRYLNAGPNDTFVLIKDEKSTNAVSKGDAGFSSEKYQQYYNKVKVEHGIVNLNYKSGSLKTLSGEYYQLDNLSVNPSMPEKQALNLALQHMKAKIYKWEIEKEEAFLSASTSNPNATYYPKGELVICTDQLGRNRNKNVLAYKFDVYAHDPIQRDYIYVNAISGEIVLVDPILKHGHQPATGTAATRYSGERPIPTTLIDHEYYLKDLTRGQGVETYNLQRSYYLPDAVEFIDLDNIWSQEEYNNQNKDDAALDAHFGASKTYDYFNQKHNRSGFDGVGGKIKSYVHYGNNIFNAFWDGSVVLFGDGDDYADPLTTLDIVAHEIGHGLCQYTANLVYAYEPGALNEGLSDIWGACIENYVDPTKSIWLIGEETKRPIRSMSDPNQYYHPDTYKGDYWFTGDWDNGGVHFNSGVLNHWFYILTEGKSGVNDHGYSYSVEGLGIDKAAKITFRTEVSYLTPNSQYQDARNLSIQAAIDIYGEGSNEAKQTAKAWDAVGVYHKLATPTSLTAVVANSNSIKLQWKDNSNDEIGFKIERAAIGTEVFKEIASVPANVNTFLDNSLGSNEVYFYRVKSFSEDGISDYSNVAYASLGTTPNIVVMKDTAIKICEGILFDPGTLGNYPDNKNYITTLTPTIAGNKIAIDFTEFNLESYHDYLYIHDGGNTNAPVIGGFTGSYILSKIVASNPSGQITLQFISNRSNNLSGFKGRISCIDPSGPPAPPQSLTGSSFTTKVSLFWEDVSYNETGFSIERSKSMNKGFTQVGQTRGNFTTFTDLTAAANTTYYYRVRAFNDKHKSNYTNTVRIQTGNSPINMRNNLVVRTCDAVFLDPGGFTNYPNNSYAITTFYPNMAEKILQVAFNEYYVNYGTDLLMIYDGPNTQSPVLFDGSKTYWIDTVTASNSSGALTFQFSSGGHMTYPGWTSHIRCIDFPPAGPSNLTATLNESNAIKLSWSDNSSNERGFIIQKSWGGNQYFSEIARVAGNVTEYEDIYLPYPGFAVFYRVIAYNSEGGKSIPSNEANFSFPLIMSNTTISSCNYQLLEPGGIGNYEDNTITQMTLYPGNWKSKTSISFSSFDTEENDILYIYDGTSTSDELLGKFSGKNIPPKFTGTTTSGALTLVFVTDDSGNAAGWSAWVECNVGPALLNTPESNSEESHVGVENTIEDLTNQILVYPNPASSHFTIKLPSSEKWSAINLLELNGNKKSIVKGDLKSEIEIDTKVMKKGINVLQIISGQNVITKKVIIE